MDVRHLKYFVQIVESGSLSEAARQLYISQPALSSRMARFEEEIGESLMTRSSRGIVPTANGEAVYRHAKFILRQIAEVKNVVKRDAADVRGRVVLGLVPSIGSVLAIPLIKSLRAKFPSLTVHLRYGTPEHLEGLAKMGQLDVAVLFSPKQGDLDCHLLLEEDVALILPEESDLLAADKTSVTLAEIARLPLVMTGEHLGLRRKIDFEFMRAKLDMNVLVEIDSLHLIMRYVAEGGGATIQTAASVRAAERQGRWRCLPISDAHIIRTSYLCSQPFQKLSTAAQAVRTEVVSVAHHLVDSREWIGARLVLPTR